jgi:hypothetical protein
MELIPAKNDQNYLDQSRLWERELVDYIDRCQKQSSGADSLSEIAASLARQELRRCLQARALIRRHSDLALVEIVEALSDAGLSDHASALVRGNWAAVGLQIE